MTRAKSRTIVDVLEEKFMPNTWSEDIYQALKEIQTLIKASKPKHKAESNTGCKWPNHPDNIKCLTVHVPPLRASKIPDNIAYNQAIDDYEANLLKILGGESE